MTEVYKVQIPGQFPVTLHKDRADFEVHYGAEVRRGLGYAQASHQFGECLFHALSCAGLMD